MVGGVGGPKPRRRTCPSGSARSGEPYGTGGRHAPSSPSHATRDLATRRGVVRGVRGGSRHVSIRTVGPIRLVLELMRTEESRPDQARKKILGKFPDCGAVRFSEKRSRRLRSPAPDQEWPKAPGFIAAAAVLGGARRAHAASRGASRRTRDARFASFAKHPRDVRSARALARTRTHRLTAPRARREIREGGTLFSPLHAAISLASHARVAEHGRPRALLLGGAVVG